MASAKLLMLVFTMTYAFVFYTLAIRPLFHDPGIAEDILITLASVALFSILLIHAILGLEEKKAKLV
ncbi:ECU04_1357 [Encephalitozoon cuniculi GB-M1]|uniref:ECU04_1357 protein n=1 Tax=Encephalitozoon cuniculi (strain GB-M1) TaxID=284813 RepID=I7L4F0_ENCCU|nr:uncharacterized protein ECU04_1357 [Encephalitozoon cuniculi GB-M1]KMV66340.1 hypothetical protein M970_041320 [Encephalitozoon cuniculi EcunIII-L]CCI73930.1 ECU04_1357 [Encephalitozoon cuniculi GB-M1]